MKSRARPIILFSIFTIAWAISCADNPQASRGESNPEGEQLMKTNCITCHNPSADVNDRIAPPMFAVKKHYQDEAMDLDQFKKSMIQFLKGPTTERSKMPGAVRRFGLMPKFGYTEQQMNDVAEYMYYTDFEKPGWFDQHYAEEHGATATGEEKAHADFKSEGQGYAMATKSVLGRNLMGQITANGAENALQFCNEKAIHLTDSMATTQSVAIKRVSDKPRNPNNRASAKEAAYILSQKKALTNGVKPEPMTFELNGSTIGYFPIMTNAMCLQCHGNTSSDISPRVQEKVKELYPEDEAIGYRENELRGIWVVEKAPNADSKD